MLWSEPSCISTCIDSVIRGDRSSAGIVLIFGGCQRCDLVHRTGDGHVVWIGGARRSNHLASTRELLLLEFDSRRKTWLVSGCSAIQRILWTFGVNGWRRARCVSLDGVVPEADHRPLHGHRGSPPLGSRPAPGLTLPPFATGELCAIGALGGCFPLAWILHEGRRETGSGLFWQGVVSVLTGSNSEHVVEDQNGRKDAARNDLGQSQQAFVNGSKQGVMSASHRGLRTGLV